MGRRKRLAKGECSFLSERRQAAELARTGHIARFICARMEMRTHHAFMVGLRAKFAPVRCLRAKQKDGVYRPFCFAGGDNKTRTCDLYDVNVAL